MPEDPYVELRAFLDRFPLGFPPTPSRVELKILKRLFTPEEASLAVKLSARPEGVEEIAERTGMAPGALEPILDAMARKGLVFKMRRQGKACYNAAPFMIGLYEYSVKRIDRELAALYREYYDSAYADEMGASHVPGFKVIPVNRHVASDLVLLPYQKMEEDIRSARVIAVTDCICRKEAALVGEACDHPLETCLSFGAAAEYYIENGLGRRISADEAIRILEEADESGLVHAGANSKHLSNICNCCPCCCASMKGITQKGMKRRQFMNAIFEAVVDEDSCTACEVCVDRCPVGAVSVDDWAVVDRDRCLGCGLCAGTCPTEAITMKLRQDREEPFDRVLDMGLAILEGKKKHAKVPSGRETA